MAPPVIVTGASRGIGRHCALALAAAGHPIIMLGRASAAADQTAADIRAAGGHCHHAPADIRHYPEVAQAVTDAAAHCDQSGWATPQLLVHAAGVAEPDAVTLWDEDPAVFADVINVNVIGAFNVLRAVIPVLQQGSGPARVINLNSGAGIRSHSHRAGYYASKAALFRLGGAVHLAGHDHGVLAFELAPGVVETEMTATMAEHSDRTDWTSPDDVTDLVTAISDGSLDAWSGRMIRAGVDTVASLQAVSRRGLPTGARDVTLSSYGDDDPLVR